MFSTIHLQVNKFNFFAYTVFLSTQYYQKVISLCNLNKARQACTSVQSDQAIFCWLASSHHDIPKNDNGEFQKWKMDYSI